MVTEPGVRTGLEQVAKWGLWLLLFTFVSPPPLPRLLSCCNTRLILCLISFPHLGTQYLNNPSFRSCSVCLRFVRWKPERSEKEMATPSSVLAWRIPEMGEPGGLPSMRLHRVRHDWSDLAAAAAAATWEISDWFKPKTKILLVLVYVFISDHWGTILLLKEWYYYDGNSDITENWPGCLFDLV